MGTPFQNIYDLFLSQIKDYELAQLAITDKEALKENLQLWLMSSLLYFQICKKDLEDYLLLFEDSGWTHLAGDKSSGRQYFMKEDSNANDDIFSDQRSKAERYKRMADVWLNLAISYIPIAVTLYLTKFADFGSILNPKSLYLTPGLWELTGLSFWKAFLFETPFALGRGFAWSIFPVLIILYIIFAIKARVEYKKFTSDNNLDY